MKLRDHTQPCEHDSPDSYEWRGIWFCTWQEGDEGSCPGGRAIEVDYEAATEKAITQEPWAVGSSLGMDSYAKNIVDAALGIGDNDATD